jgi:CRP/FNR family transcriptional regulator, cyclic AMP receptor protein
MSERPTPESLRAVPLLASLTPDELRGFAALAQLQRIPAQRPLFREGDPADSLVLVLSGSAEVVKKDPGGKHQVLAVLSAPAVLGEMTVLEAGARRSASALALSPLEAASVPGAELRSRIAAGDVVSLKVAAAIARVLARRLADVDARLVQLLQAVPHIEQLAEFRRTLQRWSD